MIMLLNFIVYDAFKLFLERFYQDIFNALFESFCKRSTIKVAGIIAKLVFAKALLSLSSENLLLWNWGTMFSWLY